MADLAAIRGSIERRKNGKITDKLSCRKSKCRNDTRRCIKKYENIKKYTGKLGKRIIRTNNYARKKTV